jgi:hypothetical protein
MVKRKPGNGPVRVREDRIVGKPLGSDAPPTGPARGAVGETWETASVKAMAIFRSMAKLPTPMAPDPAEPKV